MGDGEKALTALAITATLERIAENAAGYERGAMSAEAFASFVSAELERLNNRLSGRIEP